MKPLVFIDGDQGTTGLHIHAALAARTDLSLLTVPADSRKDPLARAQAINECDIAILCLPDGPAAQAAASVKNPAVRIIDASSAHRTHADWVYGFPEMAAGQAERIATAKRVSNPGCYPTGAIALLRPLVDAGLVGSKHPITVHAVSGYSGRGRAGLDEHEGTSSTSALPYQVYGLRLTHKHVPEIQQHAKLPSRPIFVPSYGSFRQGIVLTIPLHLHALPAGTDAAALQACLARHYGGSRHVEVMSMADADATERLDPQALNGSNDLQLSVFANAQHGQVLLTAVFDNLGKGACGAALQNLDLMLAA